MCGISPQFQTWRQEIGQLDKKIAQRGNVTLPFFALKGMIHEKKVMVKLLFGPFHGSTVLFETGLFARFLLVMLHAKKRYSSFVNTIRILGCEVHRSSIGFT
jgi:hypothetical protein